MRPRIAIPVPHSLRPEYVQRSLPQYCHAIEQAGGEPVRIALDLPPAQVARIIATCDAVLLPGSPADVDPQKYDRPRDPHTTAADPKRDMVDELLLQDAFNMRKPVFGICYGLQSLNVWRTGTLRQHIEGTGIEHEAGREVVAAHEVRIVPSSRLASILANPTADAEQWAALQAVWTAAQRAGTPPPDVAAPPSESGAPASSPANARQRATDRADASLADPALEIETNSSHHQSAEIIGDGLRAVAQSPDGVVEAIEGASPEHFVLAVQWHPERTVDTDERSRALFRALVESARHWRARHQEASE